MRCRRLNWRSALRPALLLRFRWGTVWGNDERSSAEPKARTGPKTRERVSQRDRRPDEVQRRNFQPSHRGRRCLSRILLFAKNFSDEMREKQFAGRPVQVLPMISRRLRSYSWPASPGFPERITLHRESPKPGHATRPAKKAFQLKSAPPHPISFSSTMR